MHTLLWVFIVGLGSGVLFHFFAPCMPSPHRRERRRIIPPHRSRTTFLKCTLKFIDKAGTGPNNAAYPP